MLKNVLSMKRVRSVLRTGALPTLSGVLYFLSWIGFGIWPLAFVCFLPLLWSLKDATPQQALRRGAWMGFVAHLGGYTWIIHLLRVFASFPWPLAFAGYLLVCALQGFLFGVFALGLRAAWTASRWPLAALLPLCLCATEFVYPLIFQSYTGVALMPLLPLVQVADLGGPLLLTALQAAVNGGVADAALAWRESRTAPTATTTATTTTTATATTTGTSTTTTTSNSTPKRTRPRVRWRPLAGAALFAAVASTYGIARMANVAGREREAPRRRIGIAQPNVGEIELHKNPYASVQTLWRQTAELHARGADLVVWPEVGYNLERVADGERDGRRIQGGIPVSLIAGVMRAEGKRAWNSAILISPDGRIGDHFDKIQLLAFGEYIPFGDWFPFLYEWSPLAAPLSRGTSTAPLRDGRFSFATFICYEDILPGIVRQTMEDHGFGRAHALVNLTNDSWYGAGHEQEQHLMLAAVRSIEHRRWLVRATSTGISAFVDTLGRVVQRIPRNVDGVALREVPMMEGTTIYERLGDWPGWLSLAALALLAARELLRRRRAGRKPARTTV